MMFGKSFVIEDGCRKALGDAGIVSLETAFNFQAGRDLAKANIGQWRKRIVFTSPDGSTFFMKRYHRAPIAEQIKNWLSHGRIGSLASSDVWPSAGLAQAGIQTPRVAAQGQQWGMLFEKRSVSITEKIPHGEALERQLPKCFSDGSEKGLRQKRQFLRQLGQWAGKFHASGWRHRDFYLSHIFLTDRGILYLIDLQRAFKPDHLAERYRRKDAAQLYYSMPRESFSLTDRLRVYLAYADAEKLSRRDKRFIAGVLLKVGKMTEHDRRHGKTSPYRGKAV
jgi:hypothetical protein